jgi:predicted transposase/invertase (TIGR01784 family)
MPPLRLRRRRATGISPRVDCVFRALFADPARAHLLVDFLNALLDRAAPIVTVEHRNPVHLPDFVGDDHTSVDVKAIDASGRIFQVEMQTWNHTALRARILYTWADLYEEQLREGDGYEALRPVISIWLLNRNLFRNAARFHHRFGLWDPEEALRLHQDLDIHVVELNRWRRSPPEATPLPLRRWLAFLTEAERWGDVPEDLQHPILEDAMSVLETFKTNRDWNETYRSRLDAERVRITEMRAREEAERARDEALRAREKTEHAREEAERAREKTEHALLESEHARMAQQANQEALAKRLREMEAQLRALGVEPKLS